MALGDAAIVASNGGAVAYVAKHLAIALYLALTAAALLRARPRPEG